MNKQFHLKESKTFCMFPWVHIYVSPEGRTAPCCVSGYATNNDMGGIRDKKLLDVVNSPGMNTLRKEMLSETFSPSCHQCHKAETIGVQSTRQGANMNFGHYYDDAVPRTDESGSLSSFKMRFFDIRFSNICSFKCRTCDSSFSSQWEQEDLKSHRRGARVITKNNSVDLVQDAIQYIDDMEIAYFAGGEPLITEEHYILLEEMIRRKRTDIKLRYNTNLSNFKFKDKDLLGLWKNFSKKIEIYASIDHYGARAEYIRHGTDWATVENNFKLAQMTPYISIQMNTVVSVYNFVTLHDFYQYLLDHDLYRSGDAAFSTFASTTPVYLSAKLLPNTLKQIGKAGLENTIEKFKEMKFDTSNISPLENVILGTMSQDNWDEQRDAFRQETRRVDALRGEDFVKTFPELASMMEE